MNDKTNKESRLSKPSPTSSCLLVRIKANDVAMFRFLLESYENVAYFTVLEKKTALLKVVFTPESEELARKTLRAISRSISIEISAWPF